jgi:hypothetical protein
MNQAWACSTLIVYNQEERIWKWIINENAIRHAGGTKTFAAQFGPMPGCFACFLKGIQNKLAAERQAFFSPNTKTLLTKTTTTKSFCCFNTAFKNGAEFKGAIYVDWQGGKLKTQHYEHVLHLELMALWA